MDFCVFDHQRVSYGIPMQAVREVLTFPRITPMPLLPPSILGITHVRGEVVTICDVARLNEDQISANLDPVSVPRVIISFAGDELLGIAAEMVDLARTVPADSTGHSPGEPQIMSPRQSSGRNFQAIDLSRLTRELQSQLQGGMTT